VYVLLLRCLQRRRIEKELAAKGMTLSAAPSMLKAALLFGGAAGIAIDVGLGVRIMLLQFLPSMHLGVILIRAALACVISLSVYFGVARIFRVRELTQLEQILMRKLRVRASNQLFPNETQNAHLKARNASGLKGHSLSKERSAYQGQRPSLRFDV